MTTSEMVARIKDRTHHQDDARVIEELNGAQSWAFNRIYDSESGADVLVTLDEEITLSANTREIDLESNLAFRIAGIKTLWLKFPTDTIFIPMYPVDAKNQQFLLADTLSSAETPVSGHPVYYYVENFSSVRFGGLLPSGAIIRVDYFRFPPDLDPTANDALTSGSDLPEVTHEAIVDYATAEIWDALDDDRADERMKRAIMRMYDALYILKDRTKGPTRTSPFYARRRRWI